jgi:hypothetical protein
LIKIDGFKTTCPIWHYGQVGKLKWKVFKVDLSNKKEIKEEKTCIWGQCKVDWTKMDVMVAYLQCECGSNKKNVLYILKLLV